MARAIRGATVLWLALLLSACASNRPVPVRPFVMGADNFAFPNELLWRYEPDAEGKLRGVKQDPAPEFIHHCFPVARAAREFFYHAKFAPAEPRLGENGYRKLVRQVIGRDSRTPSAETEKIVLPGFANLREFSAAYPELLKEECGSKFNSYAQRGNWRMIFPFTKHGQERVAEKLESSLKRARLPVVHVTDFPTHTINHALLLTAVHRAGDRIEFDCYDPNDPSMLARLEFNTEEKRFYFEKNSYFAGGPVHIYEVYRNAFF